MYTFRQSYLLVLLVWISTFLLIFIWPQGQPVSDRGDFLIRNTIRVALLFWVIAVGLMLQSKRNLARFLWTLACIGYWIHVATAFEYAHHWSHREAFNHVEAISGYGEGIFVSYFFTLLWMVDVIWWWGWRERYENRPKWISYFIHGFMVFVIFNGTVIFESGFIRWSGMIAFGGLVLLWFTRSKIPGTVEERSADSRVECFRSKRQP
jgi:hypothetical protein